MYFYRLEIINENQVWIVVGPILAMRKAVNEINGYLFLSNIQCVSKNLFRLKGMPSTADGTLKILQWK